MKQRTPLGRLRRGTVLLIILLIIAVIGYRLTGRTWLDSCYFVVITISSVGFGEQSSLDPEVKIFTILLIVLGGSTAFYLGGGFVQMMIEGEMDRILGRKLTTREIRRLNDHVIVCGFGRTSEMLAADLSRHGRRFVILEQLPERVAEARELGYIALTDNSTEEDALINAGIHRAKAIVTTLPSDADNVFLTLTARNLNPNLQIIARAEFKSTEKKLLQAGADQVVLPAATGANRMSMLLTRPRALELAELVSGHLITDVEIAELTITEQSPLAGLSLRDSNVRAKFGLLVIGTQVGDEMKFNPEPDTQIMAGDQLIVMGRVVDIERFTTENMLG